MTGKTILHYHIIEKLGEGGLGVVYKAEDIKLKRTVALKFLTPDLSGDPESNHRIIMEAQEASALDHTNICNIHAIEETGQGQVFICMAYYEGETLKQKIAQGPLLIEEAIDIVIQIAQGLVKAHEQGIVHRDLKPTNIMITTGGIVKILDFGLAKVADFILNKTGTTLGTTAYMSPEQVFGETVDHRTDIWSLGVVLYEVVTGQLPFKGEFEPSVIYAILKKYPKPMSYLRPNVPKKLENIVDKCLEKAVNKRYQTAVDVTADLRHFQQRWSTPTQVRGPKARPTTAAQQRRKWPWWTGLAAVIAVLIMIFLRFFTLSEKMPTSQSKMLVVLPFENLGQSEEEYFADGMTDEITTLLAMIKELGVITRMSAFQYKNTDKTIEQIGNELGVNYVLRGTIHGQEILKPQSPVRISTQLIRIDDNTSLWVKNFDVNLSAIFEVQAEIAEQVARVLDINLLPPKPKALKAKPTENLEAYRYYLRGLEYMHRSTTESDKKFKLAKEMFQKAVALDSNFALAYAWLSLNHSLTYNLNFDQSQERATKAKEAALKALELNPSLPFAHLALGTYYAWCKLDYERALVKLNIVLNQSPNDYAATQSIGEVYRHQGKFKQALKYYEKALELNPINPWLTFNIAEIYGFLGKYQEAVRYCNRTISLASEFYRAYSQKGSLYLKIDGNTIRARQVIQKATEKVNFELLREDLHWLDILDRNYQKAMDRLSLTNTDSASYYLLKAELYNYMKQPQHMYIYSDSARMILEAQGPSKAEDDFFHHRLALAYACLGRKEEAIRLANKAIEIRPVSKDILCCGVGLLKLARIYAIVGEYDTAIDKLEYLLSSMPYVISKPELRLEPRWDPLRHHLRFQRLLKSFKN